MNNSAPIDSHAVAEHPTDDILAALSSEDGLPREAMRAAVARWESVFPVLLQRLEAYLDDPAGRKADADLLFFAVHLCGQMRETRAYAALMRLSMLPPRDVGPVLGDAVTSTWQQIAASVFDGDPGPLQAAIEAPAADPFVRAMLFEALAFLTSEGRIPREQTVAFLRRCGDALAPREDNYAWVGWQSAISWLGASELREAVRQAFADDRIGEEFMEFGDFERDLEWGLAGRVGDDVAGRDLRYFGDAIDEFSSWYGFSEDGIAERWRTEAGTEASDMDEAYDLDEDALPNLETYVNPMRHVGRNDPCPCGSGKKYKKCCLK